MNRKNIQRLLSSFATFKQNLEELEELNERIKKMNNLEIIEDYYHFDRKNIDIKGAQKPTFFSFSFFRQKTYSREQLIQLINKEIKQHQNQQKYLMSRMSSSLKGSILDPFSTYTTDYENKMKRNDELDGLIKGTEEKIKKLQEQLNWPNQGFSSFFQEVLVALSFFTKNQARINLKNDRRDLKKYEKEQKKITAELKEQEQLLKDLINLEGFDTTLIDKQYCCDRTLVSFMSHQSSKEDQNLSHTLISQFNHSVEVIKRLVNPIDQSNEAIHQESSLLQDNNTNPVTLVLSPAPETLVVTQPSKQISPSALKELKGILNEWVTQSQNTSCNSYYDCERLTERVAGSKGILGQLATLSEGDIDEEIKENKRILYKKFQEMQVEWRNSSHEWVGKLKSTKENFNPEASMSMRSKP